MHFSLKYPPIICNQFYISLIINKLNKQIRKVANRVANTIQYMIWYDVSNSFFNILHKKNVI